MLSGKLETVTKIIEVFGTSGADEVEIVEGTLRIRLRRFADCTIAPAFGAEAIPGEIGAAAGNSSAQATPGVVAAPMHGVFHHASAPGAEPFVSIGSTVQAGQQLCILEAMKVFNALAAPRAGVIVAIHVENGSDVMAGQPLFTIDSGGTAA